MTSGTEEQTSVLGAEGFVVEGGSEGVCRGLLFAEGDVVVDAVLLLILGSHAFYQLFEEFAVLGRNGEMYVGAPVGGGIEGSLYEVFFERCACAVGVFVEL